jgi:endo-1,4-beta-xylanase
MRVITRRNAIVSSLATLACTIGSPVSASSGSRGQFQLNGVSLDALALTKGLRFGSALCFEELSDARLRKIVQAECGVITPGNELKWPETEPVPGGFSFTNGDGIASFAKKYGLLLRGHTLLFLRPTSLPKWLDKVCSEENPRTHLEKIISRHVSAECAHYQQIQSWDVVNEAIDPATGTFRQSVLMTAMGPDVIDYMFHSARQAAPHVQLVYNDYMRWNLSSKNHRKGVLKLLSDLRKRNVPVDAVGLQSHLGPHSGDTYSGSAKQQEKDWRAFLDEVASMGYAMLITELDILDNDLDGGAASRDRAAADYVRAYLDLTLSYTQVQQVVSWGMLDKYSWRGKMHPRQDGLPSHPLPYSNDYQPKPLRDAIASAIRAAPSRT